MNDTRISGKSQARSRAEISRRKFVASGYFALGTSLWSVPLIYRKYVLALRDDAMYHAMGHEANGGSSWSVREETNPGWDNAVRLLEEAA